MATLRDIKSRIAAVSSIERITSAMKMVSFVKSKKVQKLVEDARPYNKKIAEILKLIATSDKTIMEEHPCFSSINETVKNVVIIIIASDKGMCGSFNSNLFKKIDKYFKDEFHIKYPGAVPHLITLGNKASDYYNKKNYHIIKKFTNVFRKVDYSIVEDVHSLIEDNFLLGRIDKVEIFYNVFINVMKQEPSHFQLLPIQFDQIYNIEGGDSIDYLFEPDKKIIFDVLINQYLDA